MKQTLERCEKLEDLNVWPHFPRLKAKQWLSNFENSEKEYANALLASFLFFNEHMCSQLLKSAFSRIVSYFYSLPLDEQRASWVEFLETAIFTFPADTNPSKSGPSNVRFARQELKFDVDRIYTPENAVWALKDGKSKYVVFIDDFVGSGDQFTSTWREPYKRGKEILCYNQLCNNGVMAFYTPYIATEYGLKEISKLCDNHNIFPGQTLPNNYCAFSKDSIIWPDHLRATACDFIERASFRAGIKDPRGHHGLGFSIATHKSIPDVTLPLFYHKSDSWHPLMERV